MKKFLVLGILMGLYHGSAMANSTKKVIGVATVCDCFERTIDGETYLGKVGNKTPARSEKAARTMAYSQCKRNERMQGFSASIQNCVYSKAVEERYGKVVKNRIERIIDDEENNLHNDLISTL